MFTTCPQFCILLPVVLGITLLNNLVQLRPKDIFLENEKEALEHVKPGIKICPNREHIFQYKLKNTQTAILKIAALLLLDVFCKKDVFTVDQKWKNNIYKLGKNDDRISILQSAKF